RANAEILARLEPAFEVVVVDPSLLPLREEQAALVARRRQSHGSVFQQLFRIDGGVRIEVRLQLGEPDLHRRAAPLGLGRHVVGEGSWQGRRFTETWFHSVSLRFGPGLPLGFRSPRCYSVASLARSSDDVPPRVHTMHSSRLAFRAFLALSLSASLSL